MKTLTFDNAFVNALVHKGKKKYTIVKTNEKSLWLSQNDRFVEFWKDRSKGATWKGFVERFGATKTNYDGLEISDAEIEKGKEFAKIAKRSKEKRYMNHAEEQVVKQIFKKYLKIKSVGHYPIMIKKDAPTIVLFHKSGQALIRRENRFFYYDLATGEYRFYKKVGEPKKPIEWIERKVRLKIK